MAIVNTLVENIQDVPNLVYRITVDYENETNAGPTTTEFIFPFQEGTTLTGAGFYRRQPPDPDEMWAVIVDYNPVDNIALWPQMWITDDGPPPPATLRQVVLSTFPAADDAGTWSVQYYLKWYKQADGGNVTFSTGP